MFSAQMEPSVSSIAGEVREFLADLRREFPELYPIAPPSDREAARRKLEERLAHWGPRLGVDYGRVSVRDQRTLWGSCSPRGDLSFNWRLVFAPEPVMDYVVIHELAHRREMNHSTRFWAIVAEFSPSFREHRKWLHVNYSGLREAKAA